MSAAKSKVRINQIIRNERLWIFKNIMHHCSPRSYSSVWNLLTSLCAILGRKRKKKKSKLCYDLSGPSCEIVLWSLYSFVSSFALCVCRNNCSPAVILFFSWLRFVLVVNSFSDYLFVQKQNIIYVIYFNLVISVQISSRLPEVNIIIPLIRNDRKPLYFHFTCLRVKFTTYSTMCMIFIIFRLVVGIDNIGCYTFPNYAFIVTPMLPKLLRNFNDYARTIFIKYSVMNFQPTSLLSYEVWSYLWNPSSHPL